MTCPSPCNSCQQDLFETLGWTLWVPSTYALNAVVINPGDSNLYISLADGNTTTPAQPGTLWALTTVAQLIATSSAADVLNVLGYLPWSALTTYPKNAGVIYNGYVCINNLSGSNLNNTPPSSPGSNTYWTSYTYFQITQQYILNNINA